MMAVGWIVLGLDLAMRRVTMQPSSYELVCARCGVLEDPPEVQASPGPGMSAEHLARKRDLRAGRLAT